MSLEFLKSTRSSSISFLAGNRDWQKSDSRTTTVDIRWENIASDLWNSPCHPLGLSATLAFWRRMLASARMGLILAHQSPGNHSARHTAKQTCYAPSITVFPLKLISFPYAE